MNLTLKDLQNGFNQSFSTNIKVSFDNPNYNFIKDVNKNLYKFAGAKTYQQLTDFNNMLKGPDGKMISFADFQKNIEDYRSTALGIDEQYNRNWLYSEYQNAVNSGLGAKRWDEFQKTADLFPNLEYRTAGDSQVRPEHAELNGIIKPINDPWWDTYYPPNDWGCRCRARPTADGPTQDAPDITIPDMFQNNVGKTGEVFTPDHPYFTSNGVSKSGALDSAAQVLKSDYLSSQLPAYKILQGKYEVLSPINDLGGSIFRESGFTPAAEDLEIARKLSLQGDSVVLLSQDQTQATALLQNLKANFRSASSAADVNSAISDSLGVAPVTAIGLSKSVTRKALISSLGGFTNDPRFSSVILLRSGKRCVLTSKDILLKNWDILLQINL
jgi:SPP1 gp7 family putative phage head morphogenesis protein